MESKMKSLNYQAITKALQLDMNTIIGNPIITFIDEKQLDMRMSLFISLKYNFPFHYSELNSLIKFLKKLGYSALEEIPKNKNYTKENRMVTRASGFKPILVYKEIWKEWKEIYKQ